MENNYKRNTCLNVGLAVFLNFFMIGLGQISCGKIKRGIILYILSQILFITVIFLVIKPIPPFNIIAAALIYFLTFLFVIIDSVRIAKNPNNVLKLKPVIGVSLLIIISVANASFIQPTISKKIKENYIQAFKVASGAMEPTLLIGDQILTNKFQYNSQAPKRGDIVLFEYPKDTSRTFVKRVIGVGGDIIELRQRQLYINGNKTNEQFVQYLGPTEEQKEMLGKLINFGPVTVPQDSIFTMGDNRDRSYDSRFWGFVKKSQVKGKAITIYWSWDKEHNKVRWNRIGQIIN